MRAIDRAPSLGLAVLSMLACYGTLALTGALSLLGVSLTLNLHVSAAVIVALALVSGLLVASNAARNGTTGPLALAVDGASLIAWVMHGSYSRIGELSGFALLLGASLCEQRQRKCAAPSYDLRENEQC